MKKEDNKRKSKHFFFEKNKKSFEKRRFLLRVYHQHCDLTLEYRFHCNLGTWSWKI